MAHLKHLDQRENQKIKEKNEKIQQEKKTREHMIIKIGVKRRAEPRKALE